jgi:hypothetical protein
VSISSEGDTDSVETSYERNPKESGRIKLKTVYHHQKEKDGDSSETTESGFGKTKAPEEHLRILTSSQEKALSWLRRDETSSESTASVNDRCQRALVAQRDKRTTQDLIARYVAQGYRILGRPKNSEDVSEWFPEEDVRSPGSNGRPSLGRLKDHEVL